MINLNIETHYPKSKKAIAEYLAVSISIHFDMGKIAVVTPQPESLALAVEAQWRTIKDSSGRYLRFSSQTPGELLDSDVTFATIRDFMKVPPICQTLYVTYAIDKQDLYMVTSWMPSGATVILYSFKP